MKKHRVTGSDQRRYRCLGIKVQGYSSLWSRFSGVTGNMQGLYRDFVELQRGYRRVIWHGTWPQVQLRKGGKLYTDPY